MATLSPRQPLGALGSSRLHALGSVKNRQNAVSSHSPDSLNAPTKRRAPSPDILDNFDAENIDPNLSTTPHKRTKASNPVKAAVPAITLAKDVCKKPTSLYIPSSSTPKTAPISTSRGSPKHKRVGLLGKQRHSSSPFRRVDPPSFRSAKTSSVPFSIDAALSGTISSYKPKSLHNAPVELEAATAKAMPSSWFFDIHVDTADEEAANLMEHSAAVLDISSDDDAETRSRRSLEERGKENVPPPDFVPPVRAPRLNAAAAVPAVHRGVPNKAKAALKAEVVDAMLEDRAVLRALDAADFFPEGLDERSVEVVDPVIEQSKSNEDAPAAVPVAAGIEAPPCTPARNEVAAVDQSETMEGPPSR